MAPTILKVAITNITVKNVQLIVVIWHLIMIFNWLNVVAPTKRPHSTLYVPFFQELEAIKARVRQMEEESAKLKQLQMEVDRQMSTGSGQSAALNLSFEEKLEIDSK
jgi:hypothetical protein